MVSKIQTVRKLNNPTTNSFAGLFLTIVKFNLLKPKHINKETIKTENKETFYPFFKKLFIIFATMMILYKFGNLNLIIHSI